MSYLALYRKYRPSSFDKVMGQDHIVMTLKNQLAAGRIGHAYLFCGTRGTGKTSIAKLFAKAVNCEAPVDGSPCGQCAVCRSIEAHTSMNVIEIDAASNNGVDNIRDIVEEVKYSPTEGKYKVYIIDEVHMLSGGAFNALLKTLEEPPSYVIFILATTEVHKIPITILSRCQRYDFKRITVDTITECLTGLMESEGIEAEEKALRYIAKTADGSMRDAQSLLDQCIAFYLGQKLTYEKVLDVLGSVDIEVFAGLFRLICASKVDECLGLLDEIILQGRELTQFVTDFAWYMRNLLVAKTADNAAEVLEFSAERMEMLMHEAAVVSEETLIRYIRILSELSNRIRYAAQKRLLVEVELIKLCRPETEKDYSALINRIENLEKKLENGEFTAARPADRTPGAAAEQEEPAAKQEPLPKALPEDILAIAKVWSEIVKKQPPLVKTILQAATPTLGEDGRLKIVFAQEYDKATMTEEGKGRIDRLREAIAKVTGKDAEIELASSEDGAGTAKPFDITKAIKMPIEYVD